jgi:hypothetical protein
MRMRRGFEDDMIIQMLEGIAGTYEDEVTPLYAGPGDVITVSDEWAARLIEAGLAVAVASEPEAPKKKRVVV